VTASKFSKRPSELLGLTDRDVAFVFDLLCAETLIEWEEEQKDIRERRLLEEMAEKSIASSIGPTLKFDRSKAQHW
jgi:hypothetical protein